MLEAQKGTAVEYKTPPVGIEEFLNSREYVGEARLWPSVKADLIELLSDKTPYNRGLFFEPPGSGKSTLGALFLQYCLYLLGNLRDPAGHFNLDDTTKIGVLNMSISTRTASGTVYSKLRKMLLKSPWFNKYCPLDSRVESEIRLPEPLFAFSGNSSEAFPAGFDIFGSLVDEVTMFLNQSHKGAYSDQVQNIFEVLEERAESRFMEDGYVLAMGASSYMNEFVEEMIKDAKEYDNILVKRRPLWLAKPREFFSGRYFLFDTEKMKPVPGSEADGLFTRANAEEILSQIEEGVSSQPRVRSAEVPTTAGISGRSETILRRMKAI